MESDAAWELEGVGSPAPSHGLGTYFMDGFFLP